MAENDRSPGNREIQGRDRSPTIGQKIHSCADNLLQQFREIMRGLTGRRYSPAPAKRAKQKGEEDRGFRMAGFKTTAETGTGRSIRGATVHLWDAFAWLQVWRSHDPDNETGHPVPVPTVDKPYNSSPNL